MRWLLDLLYFAAAGVLAPVWLPRMIATGKIRTDWRGRLGRVHLRFRADGRPTVIIHAVSVGEVNATRPLVDRFLHAPRPLRIVVATTTDTGFAQAKALYGDSHEVVRYPLDFSFAVNRFLRSVQPDVVALMELEVWPNFTRACAARGIPVCVINGRVSARSFARYRRVRWLIAPAFRRLAAVGAQTHEYAQRFIDLGVPADRVTVTDTMKWDTAVIEDHVKGAEELAADMGIDRARPLVVAGSTAPGEHEILLAALPEGAQLLCAPRKPEWFDEAARALPGCARRSKGDRGSASGLYLLDTIGELRRAYALADVVVVGRTLVDFGGSDMMEPVGLGKATIIGPHVRNFADTARTLLEGGGLIQCPVEELARMCRALLADPRRRKELAARGREVIRAHQGAGNRHAEMIQKLLSTR